MRWTHRSDDLSWRDIDDEVIVLDLRSSKYLRLNASGAVLWNRLESGATIDQLAETLVASFDLDAGQASTDAGAFLDTCRALDLVERA